MKKIFSCLLIFVSILSLFSCKNFLNLNSDQNETGITITLPFSQKRTGFTKDDVTKYLVTITCTKNEDISYKSVATPSNPTVSFTGIEAATYLVSVIGYNDNVEIATGSATVNAIGGRTSSVKIKLSLIGKQKDADITFNNNLSGNLNSSKKINYTTYKSTFLPDYEDLFEVEHEKNDQGNPYRFCGWAAVAVQDITDENYATYISELKNIQVIQPGEPFTPSENTTLFALWFNSNSRWDRLFTVNYIRETGTSTINYITDLIKTADLGDNKYKIKIAFPELEYFYEQELPENSNIDGLITSFDCSFGYLNGHHDFGKEGVIEIDPDKEELFCVPSVFISVLEYITSDISSYTTFYPFPCFGTYTGSITILDYNKLPDPIPKSEKELLGWKVSGTDEILYPGNTLSIHDYYKDISKLPLILKPIWKSSDPSGYTSITSLSQITDKFGKYALSQDISVNSDTFTSPVLEAFYGVLDGQGHTIKFVNSSGELGTANYPLFGNIHKTAIVKDLRLIADAYTDYAGKADSSPIAWSTYGHILGVEVKGNIQNNATNRYAFGGYWNDGDSPYGTAYGCVLNAPDSELDALIAEDSNSNNLIALASDVVINGTTNSAWNSEKITESNNQVESWISINKSSNSDLEFFMRYVWDNSTSSITLVYKKN